MTFAADYLRLDLSVLPLHSPELGAGFYLGTGNNNKPLLLVAPGAGNSVVSPEGFSRRRPQPGYRSGYDQG